MLGKGKIEINLKRDEKIVSVLQTYQKGANKEGLTLDLSNRNQGQVSRTEQGRNNTKITGVRGLLQIWESLLKADRKFLSENQVSLKEVCRLC